MKPKLLLLLLLLLTLGTQAQIVNIPDPAFKSFLLLSSTTNNTARDSNGTSIKVDANNDSEIQLAEALAVYELKLNNSSIISMEGIESFSNLTRLDCSFNDITALDVSMLANLNYLDVNINELTSINVSGLANLETLFCGVNSLTSLNVSGCTGLKRLSCTDNQITTLDLTDILDLTALEFSENLISTIDVSQFPNLTSLYAGDNLLTTVDVTNQHSMQNLYLEGNQLVSVFMKNGSNELGGETWFGNNPNLAFMCVDEDEIDALLAAFPSMGLSNVNVNSYCSFTPGGDYHTIAGALKFDFNANGCDASDLPHPFIKININDGANSGATFTSSVGNYDFYTQAGTFVVTPEFENDWFTASPASATVVFPVVDNSLETENFCITANGVHKDIEVVMVPVVPARPGFDAVYKIVYKNKGNQVISGSVSCQWDYAVLDAVEFTPTPTTSGVGNYSWAYNNLMPFENREILMTLNVNAPTDNPAVNIDDILSFTAVGLVSGDETPENNTYVLDQAVVGSLDPNNIICIEGETAPAAAIGNYLHYVVNFENTGNGAAEFVVVRHDIDITKFDIASLQVLNSSHEAVARVNGNRIEFVFSGINLAPLDHGNILFKLKSKSSLEAGDSVMNRANIYFDYNFPIETNEANTVFEVLSTSDFEKDNSVTVFPNPSKGIVIIKSENNVRSVQVFDIQGRLLQTQIANESSMTLDMASQQSGIYFIKIKTDKGVKVEKLIKE